MSGEIFSIQNPNKVYVLVNDQKVVTWNITWDGFKPFESLSVDLKQGDNIIEFISDNPSISIPTDDRSLAVAIKNLSLRVSNP
jgi:hypothetical protein